MKDLLGLTRCMSKLVLLGTVLTLSFGCASVPQSFDAYKSSFAAAKTATEDIVLRGKVAAKTLAEYPTNTQSPVERLTKLKEREQAADERLYALETIDRYNTVLVQFAEGKDPKEIKSNLEKFGNSLTQIGSSRIMAAVGKAIPYAGIAAEIVVMIDEVTNRQKFVDLLKKGSEPVQGILDVLIVDANDIHTIVSQQMMMQRDYPDNRLSDIRFRFQRVADGLQIIPDVAGILKGINDSRGRLVHQKLPAIVPKEGMKVPVQSDLELLQMLADANDKEVEAANGITARVKAHYEVIEEYKKLLDHTKMSLVQLEKAIEINRPAATADFINRALALRETIIKLREGV